MFGMKSTKIYCWYMLYRMYLFFNYVSFFLQYRYFLNTCGKGSYALKSDIINPGYIDFGRNVKIKRGGRIECIQEYAGILYNPSLVFNDDISIEQNFHVTCTNNIEIGRGCMISYNVGIQDSDHSFESVETDYKQQKLAVQSVKIGENCFIGAGSIILAGTELGANCVVGANSVVRGVFPRNCIIAGNPGKLVRRI